MPQYTGTPHNDAFCEIDAHYASRLFRARKYPAPCAAVPPRLTQRGQLHELRFTGGTCLWTDCPDDAEGVGECATDADEALSAHGFAKGRTRSTDPAVVVPASQLRAGDVVAFVGVDGVERRYRLETVHTSGSYTVLRGTGVYNASAPAIAELRNGTPVAVVAASPRGADISRPCL